MPTVNNRQQSNCADPNSKIMAVHKEKECATVTQFCVTKNNGTHWQKQETELLNEHSTRNAFYEFKKNAL
jgi:hypothetical protein